MSSPGGRKLGPYQILSPIGAGGMGEVFRARDTRLDREVAIKVLPASFATDEQFRLRFEREAKTISSLNHPHICTIHDVGHEDGTDYIVMEMIEGESLADRLPKGPLPLDQVLRYGAQIAAALDAAHRRGIVHRDLKPGNVMLTKSGAKLLDFGLAKPLSAARPSSAPEDATQHKPLTQEGTVLGTFQYMAPEQLAGEEADARTDIFALGAVLYEMATGARAFTGKNRTSLIANILGVNPRPISELQPLTPPALERLVQRCLAKDPDDRWQSAADVAEELKWIAQSGSQVGLAAPVTMRRRSRTIVTAAFAAVIGAALAATAMYFANESKQTPLRFTISTPETLRIVGSNGGGAVIVARDGRSIVFVGQDTAGTKRLYVRSFDNFDPKPIPLTEGATYPFWSPDGRAIGFFSGGKLKRIDLSGAPPVTLADAPDGRGGTWSKNGTILYAPSIASALMRTNASGGGSAPATQLPAGEQGHRFPSFFPDGDHFIYFKTGTRPIRGIWISSLSSRETRRLSEAQGAGVVSDVDEILYVRDGVLLAQRVDLGKLTISGDARPIAQNVSATTERNYQLLSSSPATLVFQTGGIPRSGFTWFDRAGKNLGAIGSPDEFAEPSFLGAHSKVVTALFNSNSLSTIDLTNGRATRITFQDEDYSSPAATPDGSRVISSATVNGRPSLVEILQGRPRTIVGQFNKPKYPDYFDRTGEILLVEGEREDGRGDFDIFAARRSAGYKLEPLLDSTVNEAHAQLSPDGTFIAYSSDESGRAEVYVQPVPPTGKKWQVSADGGDQAQWRADGKELFYLSPDAKIMSLPVRNATPFEPGEPAPLFATHIEPASVLSYRNQYLVTGDGQRFLVLDPVQSPNANELSVITNWKRR